MRRLVLLLFLTLPVWAELDSRLAGPWECLISGVPTALTIEADGRCRMTSGGKAYQGTFETNGTHYRVSWDNVGTLEGTWSIDGQGQLTMVSTDRRRTTWERPQTTVAGPPVVAPPLSPVLQGSSNQTVQQALEAEASGDYYNAATQYDSVLTGASDLTSADDAEARAQHIPVIEASARRLARDPLAREAARRAAFCYCAVLRERLQGSQKYSYLNPNLQQFTRDMNKQLRRCYDFLKTAEPQNAAWPYLGAVVNAADQGSSHYGYIYAWGLLQVALNHPTISASTRQKAVALLHHIKPGVTLQSKDMDRAKFDHFKFIVANVEHPTIIETRNARTGEVISTFNSSHTLDSFYYNYCKDMLRTAYPQFKNNYDAFVRWIRSQPNPAAPVPAGPSDDDVALYCLPLFEKQAFGPLDLSTGRF